MLLGRIKGFNQVVVVSWGGLELRHWELVLYLTQLDYVVVH